MKTVELLIQPDGNMKSLYTDELDLTEFGKLNVERASHVEFDDTEQTWTVRLAKTGNEIGSGFNTRAEALAFEVEYLNREELV